MLSEAIQKDKIALIRQDQRISTIIIILFQLGLNKVFQSDADLSGISDQAISLSKAVQKAKIEVTEHGVTAVAATGKV